MWNVEKDPHLDPTFGSVTILDASPDLDRLRRRLLRMVDRIPRLHQRVVPSLGRLAPPEWQDDPEFDIDYHMRHVALPAPGSRRQLFDLATLLVRDPFDRTASALGVRRGRRPRGRPRRAGAEDAPHHHRRRGRHPDVGAVHRCRTGRARHRRDRADARAPDARRQHLRDGRRHHRPHVAAHPGVWPSAAGAADREHAGASRTTRSCRPRSGRDGALGGPATHRDRPALTPRSGPSDRCGGASTCSTSTSTTPAPRPRRSAAA